MSYVSSPLSVKRALQVLMAVVAVVTLAIATHAAAARANVDYYECGNCAAVNGPERTLAAPGGIGFVSAYAKNLSGTGICAKAWVHGYEWHEYARCTSSGYEISSSSGEVGCPVGCTGHGQSVRWYQMYTYKLYGFQEWW
jgi:hypothetical protein